MKNSKLALTIRAFSTLRDVDNTLGLTPALVLVKLMQDHPRSSRVEDIARDLELPASTVSRSLYRLSEGSSCANVGEGLGLARAERADRIGGKIAAAAWSLTPTGVSLRAKLLV